MFFGKIRCCSLHLRLCCVGHIQLVYKKEDEYLSTEHDLLQTE